MSKVTTNIATGTVILDLQDKPVVLHDEPMTIGLAVANILAHAKSTDNLRSYSLALKFRDEKDLLELNSSDKEFVLSTIKSSDMYVPIVTGQILAQFNS